MPDSRFPALIVRLALAALLLPLTAGAQPADAHHSASQSLFLQWQLGTDAGSAVKIPLQIPSIRAEAALKQAVPLAAGLPALVVKRYLPAAALQQMVIPDTGPDALPAAQILIKGVKQSHELWLIAGDPQHNSLSSLIASWRYLAVPNKKERDERFGQFTNEMGRTPRLFVLPAGGGGAAKSFPAGVGASHAVPDLGCTLEIVEFFPHFSVSQTHAPKNVSDQPVNPAVRVRITRGEQKEERWVLAKLPSFGKAKATGLPVDLFLDAPVVRDRPVPDFCVVTVGAEKHEVWTRTKDKCTSVPLAFGDPIAIPGANYTFSVRRFVERGRLLESFSPTESKMGSKTVIEVEAPAAAGQTRTLWLQLGQAQILTTPKGTLNLLFGQKQPPKTPGTGRGH